MEIPKNRDEEKLLFANLAFFYRGHGVVVSITDRIAAGRRQARVIPLWDSRFVCPVRTVARVDQNRHNATSWTADGQTTWVEYQFDRKMPAVPNFFQQMVQTKWYLFSWVLRSHYSEFSQLFKEYPNFYSRRATKKWQSSFV